MPPAPPRRDRLLLLPYIGNSVTKIQKYLIQHLARPWLSPQKPPQSELFPYPTQGNTSPTKEAPTAAYRPTDSHSKGYEPILVAAPTYIGQHTNLYRSSQQPLYLRQPHPDEVTRSAQNPAPYPIETRTFVVRGYCKYRQANPPSRSLHPAYPLCQSKGSDLDNHHNTK